MKNPALVVLIGVATLGLLGGYLAGRMADAPTPELPDAREADESSDRARKLTRPRSLPNGNVPPPPAIRSHDTLETLLAAPEEGLYERMALWLMDASPEDIATYWEKRKEKENQTHAIKDLVMIG